MYIFSSDCSFFFFWTSSIIIHIIITSNEPRVVYETKFGTSVPSLDTQHLRSPSMDFRSLISILKNIIFSALLHIPFLLAPFSKMEIRKWTYAPILSTKFKATTVINTHMTLIIIKCSNFQQILSRFMFVHNLSQKLG